MHLKRHLGRGKMFQIKTYIDWSYHHFWQNSDLQYIFSVVSNLLASLCDFWDKFLVLVKMFTRLQGKSNLTKIGTYSVKEQLSS